MRFCRVVVCVLLWMGCSNPTGPGLKYTPPVMFSGFINGEAVSMGGNVYWQNRCMLKNDTLRMYFFSDNFTESNKIRHGDFMRIDFYPNSDSLIGSRDILFHLARYYDRNSSYTIAPQDSTTTDATVQLRRISLGLSHGHSVLIDNIYVTTPALGTTSGQVLEISKGIITGVVE